MAAERARRFAALIRAINGVTPDFTVHVGDIKSGASLCSDARFHGIAALFERFAQPLVYTPGDNGMDRLPPGEGGPVRATGALGAAA